LGLTGEDHTYRSLWLIFISRILKIILSAIIKGSSASGKNFLVETVTKTLPAETYISISGMSKQALIYDETDFRHRHIVQAEVDGGEAAEYNQRTLLSENRLVYHTVEKDEATGKNRGRKIEKEGPTGLITTTTSPNIHPENETRLITLAMDDSPEQTRAIKRAIAQQYMHTKKANYNLEPWINFQRLLKPKLVQIPYAEYLADHIPDTPLRMRRDFKKLMAFIEVTATLFQYQRKEIKDGV